jgi:CysZ protein
VVVSFLRAVAALGEPPMRRVVLLSFAIAVFAFAALWFAVALLLHDTALFDWRPLNWLVELLGGFAVLGLTWLLFPAVVTFIMGFYVERIAAAVEAVHYPSRGPPRAQPLSEMVAVTLRLSLIALFLNLLVLPTYLILPGINLFLFLALNGYLFGRGYFEVVALRRLDAGEARAMRSRFAGRIFLGGVVIAGLFALPLVNLVAPVIATAFMLHIFEALPRPESHSLWPRP